MGYQSIFCRYAYLKTHIITQIILQLNQFYQARDLSIVYDYYKIALFMLFASTIRSKYPQIYHVVFFPNYRFIRTQSFLNFWYCFHLIVSPIVRSIIFLSILTHVDSDSSIHSPTICTSTVLFRGPSNSKNKTDCQVPNANLPSTIGIISLVLNIIAIK